MDIKVNLAALNSVYSGLDPPQQQPATDPSGETESHPLAPAAVEQAARGNAARARAEAASTTGAPVEPEASDDESGTARKKRRKSGTGGTRGSKKGAKADEAAAATAAGTSATSEEDGRSDQRFKWTAQLHQLFLASIFEIGLAASSPKKIHDQMRSDPKLARELLGDEIARRLLDGGSEGDIGAHHVKSHLQRYRANVKESRKAFIEQVADLMAESRLRAQEEKTTKAINPEYHAYPFVAGRAFPRVASMSIDLLTSDNASAADQEMDLHIQMMHQKNMRETIENQSKRQLVSGGAATEVLPVHAKSGEGEVGFDFDTSLLDWLGLDGDVTHLDHDLA